MNQRLTPLSCAVLVSASVACTAVFQSPTQASDPAVVSRGLTDAASGADAGPSAPDAGSAGVGPNTAQCTDPAVALHVAPEGTDSNDGSERAPLRTINAALARAEAGETVVVRAGTYEELVAFPRSGAAGKPITLKARCGERPVIDGTGKGGGVATPGLVTVADRAFVVVDGFHLTNLSGSGGNFPAGIWVRGASHDITLRNNVVDAIAAEDGGKDQGAHAIGVYGTSTTPIENLLIENNEMKDLVLGPSEALVLNGNVRKFAVTGNHVHHANNIAFDFIGYEGTCTGCTGDDLSSAAVDRVRDGVVSNNLAHDVTSRGNPAYGDERAAGCFYVDGGGRITIERNKAHDCDLGVELASEHPEKSTSEIIVRNNFLWNNFVAAISTGGYDSGTGPGGGSATRCSVVHNTIVDSSRDGWANAGLLLQNRNVANVYVNNVIVATQGGASVRVNGVGNATNEIHHNLYVNGAVEGAPAGAGSLTEPPQLVAPATGDLHLAASSPAIGAGAKLESSVAGDVDIDGEARGNDIGADQRGR